MPISKSAKEGIVVGLISSVIFLCLLEPMIKGVSKVFIFLSRQISSYFLDKLYQEIARGRTDYSLSLLSIVLVVVICAFSLVFIRPTLSFRGATFKNKINYRRLRMIAGGPGGIAAYRRRQTFRRRVLKVSLVVVLWVICVLQLISSAIKSSSIDTFEQYVRIISPYVPAIQKDMVVSEFSSMRTYDDYIHVMSQIKAIGDQKKITLPEQSYWYTY